MISSSTSASSTHTKWTSNFVLRIESFEHGGVFEQIGHDYEPHSTSSYENVIYMRHFAIFCCGNHVGQLDVPIVFCLMELSTVHVSILQFHLNNTRITKSDKV